MKPSQVLAFLSAVAFSIHASFNEVHSWPLMWPFLAGIFAVTTGRRNIEYRYRGIIRNGLWAALLVLILGMVSGNLFSRDAITSHFQQFNNPPEANPSLVFAVIVLAAVFFATWLFGSGITTIMTGRKSARSQV